QPVSQGDRARSLQTGMFDMPKPQGWTIERVVSLMAGVVVLATLTLGRERSGRWRLLTGFVGANLVMDATVGWCPSSVILHHLGVPTAAERALEGKQVS
ncbi:MAG: YgaP family membrane protein, partial [Solirubrobacteraceae bacterium]